MGAHLWWSDFEMVDMAGLVDVPMAHHKWEKPFIHQYVYEERNPEFAHVHGSWEKKTKMAKHLEWRKRYLEIPPYPISPWTTHPGCHVRRDLFVRGQWEGSIDRSARFAGGVELAGLNLPAAEVAPGQTLYVELGWRTVGRVDDFRAILFMATESGVASWDLPPAYDWLRPSQWKAGEVLVGRYSVSLPDALPPGLYDLGLAVVGTGAEATVRSVMSTPSGSGKPRFAQGEILWPAAVQVLSVDAVTVLAERQLKGAVAMADDGDCDAALRHWEAGRRHLREEEAWHAGAHARLDAAMARCFARRSEQGMSEAGMSGAEDLVAARRWDSREPEVARVGGLLADRFAGEAEKAWSNGDADAAYLGWKAALLADPSRSDLRRLAEAARDASLGLKPEPEPEDVAGGPD
jgi:hypothetical protein